MDEHPPPPGPVTPAPPGVRPVRYRRVPHRVLAEPLRERWEWFTPSGDTLAGAPGDYRITDPASGSRWSVTARALTLGYREVADGIYESRGEVDAHRLQDVDGTREVLSLEGAEVARPGDWVVSDGDGHAWVVADPWFRARYQRTPDRAPDDSTSPGA